MRYVLFRGMRILTELESYWEQITKVFPEVKDLFDNHVFPLID